MYPHIASKDNQLVKHIVKLANTRAYREETGLGVIYGLHLVQEAIEHGVLKELIVDEHKLKQYLPMLENSPDTIIHTATLDVIHKLNLLDSPTDLVGIIYQQQHVVSENMYNQSCLILEHIQDPGNLGTILRVARASGINHVLISPNSVDPYNPKVLRASQGSIFGINVYSGVDVESFIGNYAGLVVATTPHSPNNLYSTDLTQNVAWVFGNEGAGLSDEIMSKIDQKITIPMQNNSESLNVAMAVTVCLFEQLRQKQYVITA